jgi:hypothetical protein
MNLLYEMAKASYEEYFDGLIGCCEPRFEDLPPDHIDRMGRSQLKASVRAADFHPLIRAACMDLIADIPAQVIV